MQDASVAHVQAIARAEPHAAQPDSAGYVWYVIALLSVVNVFNYMDRMALAVLAPSIKADLKLSDGELGLLVGLAFALFYAICGIPIARWADRGSRRNIITLAVASWSAMTALCGAAQNFGQLFIARMGVGAGEAGGYPAAQSLICDYVPLKRRSGVFALHNLGLIVGMMLGMALSGVLAETIGWRWTFVALGVPGIVFALIVRLTLREPLRGAFDAVRGDQAKVSFGRVVTLLWRGRTYRRLLLLIVVNGFVQYGLNQWLPSYYARVFGLSLSAVGKYLGIALGVGSGLGMLFGGLLANKLAQRDVRLPLIVGAGATALSLPSVLGSLFISSAAASMGLVALTGFLWHVSNGPVIATITSIVPSGMRATAGAISILCASVLGFGLGPFCVGVLSDLLAPSLGVESLRYALLAPVGLVPVMVFALYAAAKDLPRDLRAVGAQM